MTSNTVAGEAAMSISRSIFPCSNSIGRPLQRAMIGCVSVSPMRTENAT
jgi:hypothetical protein